MFQFQKQEREKSKYVTDTKNSLLKEEDILIAPVYVFSAYLFNPYIILNCAAKTTTVFSNLLLSLVLLSMIKGVLHTGNTDFFKYFLLMDYDSYEFVRQLNTEMFYNVVCHIRSIIYLSILRQFKISPYIIVYHFRIKLFALLV